MQLRCERYLVTVSCNGVKRYCGAIVGSVFNFGELLRHRGEGRVMSRIFIGRPGHQSVGGGGRRSSFKMRLLIAAAIALFALVSYYGRPGDENQITGESQRVAFSEEADEVQMGLQAVRQVGDQFGGADRDPEATARVKQVGERLLAALDESLEPGGRANPYRDHFKFTLLADHRTVNAFALPGGPIFVTRALYDELQTEGQLAGVIAHEIGHVIERHGNERMAQQQLFQGLAAAGGVAGGDQQSAQLAQAAAQLVSMKYGREDELESDQWGVRLCALAGYDPRSMIGVMEVLDRASEGQAPPEFFSTHPKPANRVAYIKQLIAQEFPNGVPAGLER
jgi:beta-barrel assembly-enhancing protease